MDSISILLLWNLLRWERIIMISTSAICMGENWWWEWGTRVWCIAWGIFDFLNNFLSHKREENVFTEAFIAASGISILIKSSIANLKGFAIPAEISKLRGISKGWADMSNWTAQLQRGEFLHLRISHVICKVARSVRLSRDLHSTYIQECERTLFRKSAVAWIRFQNLSYPEQPISKFYQ